MNKSWQGNSVIVVDDNEGVRHQIAEVYKLVGMRVEGVAKNGLDGLDLVAKKQPALLSLDLIMPEMDGVECYRKMQKDFPSTKIVIVSWLSSEAKIIENLKNVIPSELFMPKPLSAEKLIEKLDYLFA